MSQNIEEFRNSIPVGDLGIIPLQSCSELGNMVNEYIVDWRKERESVLHQDDKIKDSYIVNTKCSRFGSGEAKGTILDSIRGKDLYLLVDVTNYSIEYSLCGHMNKMSPDDHYSDLKRIITAAAGKARRINVIMPFLYESRQHKRTARESLDCAVALQELHALGVENIITFDAHDPRVQNAIPNSGFDSIPNKSGMPKPRISFIGEPVVKSFVAFLLIFILPQGHSNIHKTCHKIPVSIRRLEFRKPYHLCAS